jgi:serine/threonine-protein kinase HipA
MSARALQAYINERRVGELRDENGIWSFTYDAQWVGAEDAYALSPALPLGLESLVDSSSTRPVQWYFDNLLPEEGARTLLAKDAKLETADAFGLLAYYGAESAGSLTLIVEGTQTQAGGARALSDAELQARIENLPRISLASRAAKRVSLAGAQHKLAVIYRDGELLEPVGPTASTHILKPDHTDPDYPSTAINEYFVMRLCRALKLDVPQVVRRYVPAPVYLVERFDRQRAADGVLRLHLVDACQALNLDRQFKYTEGRVERLSELANRCTAPAAARVKLYSWLVFNLLIGNSDAHLKNLSFLVTHEGIRLAPYYDLLATAIYETRTFDKNNWPATELAWPLSGKTVFGELTRAALLDAAAALGLTQETANRLLDAQVTRIEVSAHELLKEIDVENAHMLSARKELAPVFAGETRCLRAIVQIILRDMAARLGGLR